jgi:hypothetical protein
LNVWIDEYAPVAHDRSYEDGIPQDLSTAQEWISSFCSEEAQEVRDVLGAVIFTLDGNSPSSQEDLDNLLRFTDKLDDELWNGSALVVSREELSEELQDYIFDRGLEFIYLKKQEIKKQTNSFGEKEGIERIREILEMVPWDDESGADGVAQKPAEDLEPDKNTDESSELINSLLSKGYGKPILKEDSATGSEEQVDTLESFMDRLNAIKGLLKCSSIFC